MSILNDPSMKEIIQDFCDEANSLFDQLEASLTLMEEDPSNTKELEKFGQIIDRIMGAAKSIGATEIATFCELGKVIGYKSSQIKDLPLIEVVVAVLFDSLHMLRQMNKSLLNGNETSMNNLNTNAFVTRLNWLSAKFKDIERASCAIDNNTNLNQNSIDELMKSLGL
ncbi:MAG: Hpt domain-containing protein [Bacteriovorax sp.]|nr:Hpt domain-containing protein [Bacteriovorax sp.]